MNVLGIYMEVTRVTKYKLDYHKLIANFDKKNKKQNEQEHNV